MSTHIRISGNLASLPTTVSRVAADTSSQRCTCTGHPASACATSARSTICSVVSMAVIRRRNDETGTPVRLTQLGVSHPAVLGERQCDATVDLGEGSATSPATWEAVQRVALLDVQESTSQRLPSLAIPVTGSVRVAATPGIRPIRWVT